MKLRHPVFLVGLPQAKRAYRIGAVNRGVAIAGGAERRPVSRGRWLAARDRRGSDGCAATPNRKPPTPRQQVTIGRGFFMWTSFKVFAGKRAARYFFGGRRTVPFTPSVEIAGGSWLRVRRGALRLTSTRFEMRRVVIHDFLQRGGAVLWK